MRYTERDAMVDLSILLRLTDQSKLQVSDKTSLPGSATLRLLTESLAGGDFYGGRGSAAGGAAYPILDRAGACPRGGDPRAGTGRGQ
ncbi:hypothetical protein Tamer19_51200 [Cupriavidus sp. TA19]|nr:hypothetical protein Tamer19_51200 [Cupriavidus sp. TA19]